MKRFIFTLILCCVGFTSYAQNEDLLGSAKNETLSNMPGKRTRYIYTSIDNIATVTGNVKYGVGSYYDENDNFVVSYFVLGVIDMYEQDVRDALKFFESLFSTEGDDFLNSKERIANYFTTNSSNLKVGYTAQDGTMTWFVSTNEYRYSFKNPNYLYQCFEKGLQKIEEHKNRKK